MNRSEFRTRATLTDGRDSVPVEAEYVSRYSLNIKFLNGKSFPDGFIFPKLIFNLNGRYIKLGPCKLLKNGNPNGKSGKLVFVKDVYDFENLFFNRNIVKLQSLFINVPLILGHKNEIKNEFKEYTANLTYDLSVYKDIFDQIDEQIKSEPKDVKDMIRKSVIETEGRKYMAFFDEKLRGLEDLVRNYSNENHERHGYYFRKQLWGMILTSPIMRRTNLKPRGYAGDYEMMKMIYDNSYEGKSIFGMLMHKHPMEHPAAQAVRTRRKLIAKSFQEIDKNNNWNDKKKLSILSVACGPAYELKDILTSSVNKSNIHFTLLDQDPYALAEASRLVKKLEEKFVIKINTTLLNESVRTMLTTSQISDQWGKFHFIYSMGLFDYLTPPAARLVIKILFQLLKPDGEMIIGNFHVSNPSRIYMEYWLDWVLYYRTEQEFKDLLSSESAAEVSVFFENTGSQMFLHVKKSKSDT